MFSYSVKTVLILLFLSLPAFAFSEDIEKGVLDLEHADLDKEYFKLDGEWEIFNNLLILPDLNPIYLPSLVKVPSLTKLSHSYSPYGKATYRLTIKLPPDKDRILQLRIKRIVSAYTLYINGKKVHENGTVGCTRKSTKPDHSTAIITFNAPEERITILIQVSNFHEPAGGGILQSILIGKPDVMSQKIAFQMFFTMFIVGCFMMTGFYHIIIFLFRKKDTAPLCLGLFCIIMGLRPIFLDYYNVYSYFTNEYWTILFKIEIFTIVGSSPIIALFFRNIFFHEIKLIYVDIYIVISAISILLLAILPTPYFSMVLVAFYVPSILLAIYLPLTALFKKSEKSTGKIYFFIGYLAYFITIIHDILYSTGVVSGDFISQYGMFLFILTQTIIISERFNTKFNQTESLSEELKVSHAQQKEINEQLEIVIDEREKELNKELYEKELMKEEIRKNHKLEAIGILAGGIAHDFNNLLTIILGNIFLAKQLSTTNDILISLDDAENAGKRATDLANQLMTFSKGGTPIKKIVALKELITTTTEFSLRGSNIIYTHNIDKDLKNCEVDEGQISQVISNIVINAKQAMPDGGKISITGKNETIKSYMPGLLPGEYVVIEIADTGKGIPPDIINNIFDPFFTTKEKGKGLGLSICYSIIQKHGGIIKVRSTPCIGTVFTIYIKSTNQEAQDKSKGVLSKIDGLEKKILVVDDENNILKIMEKMLSELNFTPVCMNDPENAIKLYRKEFYTTQKFEIVILDLTIPGKIGGEEILKKLQLIDKHVKAIATSGYADNDIMNKPENYGFSGVLKKPFDITALENVIRELL